MDTQNHQEIAKLLRYYILLASTTAASGHPTSSLSATDILAVLYFNFLKYDFKNPDNLYNDRLIFSKGHATPLLYALYKLAGQITEEELLQYRTLNSPLQGHPTPQTPFVDVATGSLGMGLSFGLGMALASKIDSVPNKIYVLLGDGESAEGNIWEAIELAAHYNTSNLVGILDMNRLGETGETLLGHDIQGYEKRISAFGWDTICIDGHNYSEIYNALQQVNTSQSKPTMIIAKTIKGKGVSFLENREHRHGKALKEEEYESALKELALEEKDKTLTFLVKKPDQQKVMQPTKIDTSALEQLVTEISAKKEATATRKAYGLALQTLAQNNKDLIVYDGDLSDSTMSGMVQETTPDQFFNMFIAEQNMVAAAAGMEKMGKTVFVSTFAAFFTRAYDQIRMSALSDSNIKLCGSHAGVSIGMDGGSQMGLEDISMMRAILNSTIVYPSDAVSAAKLVGEIANNKYISYIRSTREPLPVIYDPSEKFPLGGLKTVHSSAKDLCVVIAAGITLQEALKAYSELQSDGIDIRVVDLYSIKPIDSAGLQKAAQESHNKVIVVEDHYFEGGIGDAVLNVFANTQQNTAIHKLAVTKTPHSGKPLELLEAQGISAKAIKEQVKRII